MGSKQSPQLPCTGAKPASSWERKACVRGVGGLSLLRGLDFERRHAALAALRRLELKTAYWGPDQGGGGEEGSELGWEGGPGALRAGPACAHLHAGALGSQSQQRVARPRRPLRSQDRTLPSPAHGTHRGQRTRPHLQKGQLGSSRPLTVSWNAHCTHRPCRQLATTTLTGVSMQMGHMPPSSSSLQGWERGGGGVCVYVCVCVC